MRSYWLRWVVLMFALIGSIDPRNFQSFFTGMSGSRFGPVRVSAFAAEVSRFAAADVSAGAPAAPGRARLTARSPTPPPPPGWAPAPWGAPPAGGAAV